MARIDPEYLVSTDLAYLCDNVAFVFQVETIGVPHLASPDKNGGVDDANKGNLTKRILFLLGFDWIFSGSAQDEDQN